MQLEIKEDQSLKLEKIVKEKNLYRVFFSDNTSYLCDEDALLEYKLVKNVTVKLSDIKKIASKNEYYLCLNDAIRIVNYKQYTKKQVLEKLISLKYNGEDVISVIDYLEKIKVIDDDLFYENYVEFKINQGYGPLYIKNKLYDLGINKDVVISHDQQYNLIMRQIEKVKTTKYSKSVFTKKFTQKMIIQGFNVDIINEVLNNLNLDFNNNLLNLEINKLIAKYSNKYSGNKLKQLIIRRLLSKGYNFNEIEVGIKEVEHEKYM